MLKLYPTPDQAHDLAGRVVAIFKGSGITDRPTLNRLHQIVETRAYDPAGLKLFLRNVVDLYTAPAPMPPVDQVERRRFEEDRNQVFGGQQITALSEFDAAPPTDLGETWSVPTYGVDTGTYTHEEDE